MLLSKNFAQVFKDQTKDIVVPRAGVANRFVVSASMRKRTTFEADIDEKDIILGQGESVQVLADKVGVILNEAPLQVNVFFVERGMVLEILSGQLVLEHPNGGIYSVDEDAEIETNVRPATVKWFTVNDLFAHALITSASAYGLKDRKDAVPYVNNLLLLMTLSYSTAGTTSPVTAIRVLERYEDIGLGQFAFVNYNKYASITNDEESAEDDVLNYSEIPEEEDIEVDTQGFAIEDDDQDF